MKIPQFFAKTPNHKRFSYQPRFYNPENEERLAREERIRQELEAAGKLKAEETARVSELTGKEAGYRARINGSFRQAKKTVNAQAYPSANMLRFMILMILVVGLIAFLQFGTIALYGLAAVFIPFYLFLKFRNPTKS